MRNPFKRRDKNGLGLLERSLFSVMGPPQVGENRAREGYTPDPQANLCTKCRQPWETHERVNAKNMTYVTCPAPSS